MMPLSKTRIWCVALVLFLISTIALINAPAENWKQIIVKCSPEDLDKIRAEVGAAVIDAIPGHFLLSVSSSVDSSRIEKVQGKGPIQASENALHFIPRNTRPAGSNTTTASTGRPDLGPIVDWYGTPARQGYTEQPVVGKIALKQALNTATGSGVKVALIDTGVDLEHPTLKGVFLGGKSYVGYSANPYFLNDTAIPTLSQALTDFLNQASTDFLNQASTDFLNQASTDFLNQASTDFLNQASTDFLNQASIGVFVNSSTSKSLIGAQIPAFMTHGTMMAGLIHLVAPQARITPFAAFHATGAGSEWDIVRAIYAAIESGDDVINMSFGSSQKSKIMEAAIQAAVSQGIVVVASAGNDGADITTYPGSFGDVIRVAALRDEDDQKASFSDYGSDVGVSATGTRLISTWVGGHWGMISGTSPAAALVSGEVALVKQTGSKGMSAREVVQNRVDSINWPFEYRTKLGKGRINAFKAVTRRSDDNQSGSH